MVYVAAMAILAIFAIFLSALLTPFPLCQSVYAVLLTALATFYGMRYPRYYLLLCIVNIAMLLTVTHGLLAIPDKRFMLMLGILVVLFALLLMQVICIPGFYRRLALKRQLRALRDLDRIRMDLFACLLRQEYADNLYLFERRLHKSKRRFIQHLIKLRAVSVTERLERLFEIMMDAAQIRWRVTDHTIFAVCANELDHLSSAVADINKQLCLFSKKSIVDIDTTSLEGAIKLLTDHFNHVLKVTAREPLAFLLFIASWEAWREEVESYE